MSVRPAKTQISLGIRPVWSESSLCAQWIAKDPRFLNADSDDSGQTGRMPRLIWVCARRRATLLVLSCRGSFFPDVHVGNWDGLKWAATWQNQQSDCAPNEDSDQPGHPPSPIKIFTVRMKKAWVLSYPLSAKRRLWSDWSESSLGTHSFCWFVMSRLKCLLIDRVIRVVTLWTIVFSAVALLSIRSLSLFYMHKMFIYVWNKIHIFFRGAQVSNNSFSYIPLTFNSYSLTMVCHQK